MSADHPSRERKSNRERLKVWWFPVLGLGLAACLVLSFAVGTYDISLADVLRVLGHRVTGGADDGSVAAAVVWNLRVPRGLLAVIVGAALAASGAVFQASFRNPLVEPYILGVSSGAAFGAALGMVVPGFPLSVQFAALVGGLAAVGLVQALARARPDTPAVTLILSGVIIGSIFSAGVSILKYVADEAALRDIVFWLMGGLYFASWRDAAVAGPVVVAAAALMVGGGWTLNVLAMGDHEAATLGIDPRRARRLLLGTATVATAVSVSVVGVVPWIGLMTPHAARLLLGSDNRLVVPASALLGALFLLACDTAARSLTAAEIPIGIMTAIAGAPLLAYLVRRRSPGLPG